MSEMGVTPLYLGIILARANAYSRASVTLRVSGTIVGFSCPIKAKGAFINNCMENYGHVFSTKFYEAN